MCDWIWQNLSTHCATFQNMHYIYYMSPIVIYASDEIL